MKIVTERITLVSDKITDCKGKFTITCHSPGQFRIQIPSVLSRLLPKAIYTLPTCHICSRNLQNRFISPSTMVQSTLITQNVQNTLKKLTITKVNFPSFLSFPKWGEGVNEEPKFLCFLLQIKSKLV